MTLTATVTVEPHHDTILVVVLGTLDLHTAPVLRNTLLKCLAQAPDAVLVDVAGMQVDARSRLTVFPAALRSYGGPAAVLVFGASAELASQMGGGILGDARSFTTARQARAAVAGSRPATPRRLGLRLAATPAAAGRARALIAEACRDWHLEHLRGPATLVVSELVSNAVQHAGTDLEVTVALRRDHLHLSVRDGDPRTPVRPDADPDPAHPAVRGRGIHLVEVYASAWGTHATGDGKTVWATMPAIPVD